MHESHPRIGLILSIPKMRAIHSIRMQFERSIVRNRWSGNYCIAESSLNAIATALGYITLYSIWVGMHQAAISPLLLMSDAMKREARAYNISALSCFTRGNPGREKRQRQIWGRDREIECVCVCECMRERKKQDRHGSLVFARITQDMDWMTRLSWTHLFPFSSSVCEIFLFFLVASQSVYLCDRDEEKEMNLLLLTFSSFFTSLLRSSYLSCTFWGLREKKNSLISVEERGGKEDTTDLRWEV